MSAHGTARATSGTGTGPRHTVTKRLARLAAGTRRARLAAVSLAAAAAFALAGAGVATAAPVPFERDESLSLSLDALPQGPGSVLVRVLRVPTDVHVTEVVTTTSGADEPDWTLTLCPQTDGECLPVSDALVGTLLPEGDYDLRVQVGQATSAALDGHIGLLEHPLPVRDLTRVAWLALAALLAALVGALLLRPRAPHPAPVPDPHAATATRSDDD